MSHILWDTVPKKDQARYYQAIGTVTPQAPLKALWTGRLLTPRKNHYQAELRWNSVEGQAQALMVIGVDGWDWKTHERAEAHGPGKPAWSRPRDTTGFTVRFSSNAALWFTTDHFNLLPAVAEEARQVLLAVYQEFDS